jgi:hypothetical protein
VNEECQKVNFIGETKSDLHDSFKILGLLINVMIRCKTNSPAVGAVQNVGTVVCRPITK